MLVSNEPVKLITSILGDKLLAVDKLHNKIVYDISMKGLSKGSLKYDEDDYYTDELITIGAIDIKVLLQELEDLREFKLKVELQAKAVWPQALDGHNSDEYMAKDEEYSYTLPTDPNEIF